MSNKRNIEGRRNVVKSIAAGSSAVIAGISPAESWVKPVIDSVLLPVHAATTDANLSYFGSVNANEGGVFQICIQCIGRTCFVQLLETYPDTRPDAYFYQGSGSIGASMTLTQPNNCDEFTLELTVDSVNDVAIGNFDLIDEDSEIEASATFTLSQAVCGISESDANCIELAKLKAGENSRRHG